MKYFKNLSTKKVKPVPPRTMAEINKEFSELIGKVGQAQYQVFIYTQETERLNREIQRVNNEANERSKLDQAEQLKAQQAAKETQNAEVV